MLIGATGPKHDDVATAEWMVKLHPQVGCPLGPAVHSVEDLQTAL